MKNFSSHFLPQHPNTTHRQEQENQEINRSPSPLDNDDQARCDWDFYLSSVISSSSSAGATFFDAIGVVEFDQTGGFLATGGLARKIRIYVTEKSLKPEEDGGRRVKFLDHGVACEFLMCTPAKLSSLKWRPGYGSRVIGSGDYDGVVMEYDIEQKVPIFERDEHGGMRVWSLDYSHWDPNLAASGSDDGTTQMWDPRCEGGNCVAKVKPNPDNRCPVCCVEFNPFGGPLVAVGCSDKRIYCYDVRRTVEPVFILDGHQRAVTYTRFLDLNILISSGIDGSLMMWDMEKNRLIRTYKGHVNTRRFVGLSVWGNGGLLSCGSENNQVFVYDKRWGQPIWVHGYDPTAQPGHELGFVSGVCWQSIKFVHKLTSFILCIYFINIFCEK